MESTYLEKVDTSEGLLARFWEAAVCGSQVWERCGDFGAEGEVVRKQFDDDQKALAYYREQLEWFGKDGFLPQLRPESAPDLQEVFTGTQPLSEYYLAWSAGVPIRGDAIFEAYQITDTILWEARCPASIIYVPHGDAGHVIFSSENAKAHFGYPSELFLEGLNPRERAAVLERGASRDGWLAGNGTGQGVIDTHRDLLDVAVRLFLTVLLGKQENFEVVDSEDVELEARFAAPKSLSEFKWKPYWEQRLRPAIAKQWLLEGQAAKFSSSEESQYAW